MRTVVTGSQGTLGRPLVKELEARGHEVHTCDLHHGPGERHIRLDVARHSLREWFELIEPDVCFHLAAEFGRQNGEDYPAELWNTNAVGTRRVIEACHAADTRLVFASSSEVYGEHPGVGQAGWLEESITASEVILHPNEYALSKWVNEQQIMSYQARHPELQAMRLRFFNAYGPGEHYHPYRSVVALFVWRALHGEPLTVFRNYHRTFMHINDFIPTLANAAEMFSNGEAINIGGIDYRSVEELADMVLDLTGADPSLVEYRPQEDHNTRSKKPTIEAARRVLGHRPEIRLEDGLPGTIEWMRSQC